MQAASKLGYKLLIVSDSKHSLVSAIAGGITVDFSDTELAIDIVLSATKGKKIVTVIATDDLVVTLASRIANALALPHNHPDSTELTRRKDLARQRLKESGCNVPEYSICQFDNTTELSKQVNYPVVVKPLMLSGSRGVIRANNPDEFTSATETIKSILQKQSGSEFERGHFLAEQFLQGEEIALDGFVQNGRFILFALFDKPDPLNGPYFEESYYISPSKHPLHIQQAIIDEIQKCCHAYGLTHGPIHAEARITERGIVLLEMASRTIGGQCAQIIEHVLNTKLEEIIIRLMCMEKIKLEQSSTYAGVLMIPIPKRGILKRVEGLLQAHKVEHITNIEIHIQPGYEMVPLPEGSSYLGFIFSSAESYEATFCALERAHQQLSFITTPSWSLQPATEVNY